MKFHHRVGAPLGSSGLGDPRTNVIFESFQLSIHFAADFFFLNGDGTLESRGLVQCGLDWLNAAGFNLIKKKSEGCCLSQALFLLQDICYGM